MQRGATWEQPFDGPATVVSGGDADLSAWLSMGEGAVRFRPEPSSDLARSLGLSGPPGEAGAPAVLALDALDLGPHGWAVNAVVVGPSPERLGTRHRLVGIRIAIDGRVVHDAPATTVVIANGEFVHGCDVVPRGHPGDGAFEVQVYGVPRGERAELRRRVRLGTHLPHPGIRQWRAHVVEVETRQPLALDVDGQHRPRVEHLTASIRPGALRLVVGEPA